MWITNGAQADWICLLANTSDGPPHKNKSLICVPMDTKGVSVAKKIKKIGNHASDTAQLFFEDVVVPRKNLIGEEGKGFTYQMKQFQEERMFAIAACELLSAYYYAFTYCFFAYNIKSLLALSMLIVERSNFINRFHACY